MIGKCVRVFLCRRNLFSLDNTRTFLARLLHSHIENTAVCYVPLQATSLTSLPFSHFFATRNLTETGQTVPKELVFRFLARQGFCGPRHLSKSNQAKNQHCLSSYRTDTCTVVRMHLFFLSTRASTVDTLADFGDDEAEDNEKSSEEDKEVP